MTTDPLRRRAGQARQWQRDRWARRGPRPPHPTRVIVGAFGAAVAVGTAVLALPAASASGRAAEFRDVLFTATSAVCLNGLLTRNLATHWSTFGEVAVLCLVQVGGLGIMTLATLATLLISDRLNLRARFLAQAETRALDLHDVAGVVRRIAAFTFGCQAVTALILTLREALHYGESWGRAAYLGVFHAVSAFNNAGLSPRPDNLVRYVDDPWVCGTVSVAVVVGGLGFPVVFEVVREWRTPGTWSVLTRLTLGTSGALLATGAVAYLVVEWGNPGTLGRLDGPGRVLAAVFASVQTRTAGFNSVDVAALRPESLLVTDVLMFVGGGSGGTAGGIKVTTFALLAFVIWAQVRGESDVVVGHRRVPTANQREALTIALLGVAVVVVSSAAVLALTPHGLDRVLFEVCAAFGTTGLSTGLVGELPPAGQYLMIGLMFLGRVGPLAVASALALAERGRRYSVPEERTIVG